MTRLAIAAFVLCLAPVDLSAQNPDLRIYLDFDPPSGFLKIDPAPGDTFDVCVLVDCFSAGGGIRGVAVAFERTFGGQVVAQKGLLGGLDLGDVEDPFGGWQIVAAEECVYPETEGLVVTGCVTYYYTGPPGYIRIIRTEMDKGLAIDCDHGPDYYCIAGHAGVGMDPPDGETGCECYNTHTEGCSWTTLKALYR